MASRRSSRMMSTDSAQLHQKPLNSLQRAVVKPNKDAEISSTSDDDNDSVRDNEGSDSRAPTTKRRPVSAPAPAPAKRRTRTDDEEEDDDESREKENESDQEEEDSYGDEDERENDGSQDEDYKRKRRKCRHQPAQKSIAQQPYWASKDSSLKLPPYKMSAIEEKRMQQLKSHYEEVDKFVLCVEKSTSEAKFEGRTYL